MTRARTLSTLKRAGLLGRARGTLLRRASDPWESHRSGIINTLVPEPEILSHQGPDAQSVDPELDVLTMAVKVPQTLGHMHYWTVQLSRHASKEEVLAAFRSSSRIALVRIGHGHVTTNTIKEMMADMGRPHDNLYEVALWEDMLRILPHQCEQRLKDAGVQLHRFNRWNWRQPLHFNRRDHRKLLAVDGAVAFVGGFNIHRQSSMRHYGPHRWCDTHARFKGRLADDARALFEAFSSGDLDWAPTPRPGNSARLLPSTSRRCRRILRCAYRDAIAGATQRIWLSTPYFVPDGALRRMLGAAARRGVDVRILTTRPTDVPLVRWAAQALYPELLAEDVRIFEYLPRMLHAKTLVIDDDWNCIGTANFDYRSLFTNYEISLLDTSSSLTYKLATQFLQDLQEAEEVTPSTWRRRTWLSGMMAQIGYLARRWL